MVDLRKKRTKKDIQKSFANLLMKENFDNITVKMIVEDAMINRNTFYLHYQDKYDLLEKMVIAGIKKSHINWNDFIEQPFTIMGKQLNRNIHVVRMLKIQKQSKNFRKILFNSSFKAIIPQLGDSSKIWFAYGKIMAILEWNNYHNDIYKMVDDYQKLEEIFDKNKFPKISN